MSNNEIELVAAFCIAHPPLHLLKNLVISKSVCYLYKTIFFLTVTVQKWYLNMQDYVLLSNNCSEITHGISHDHDV